MDHSKITVRYAKALFLLAKEKQQLETFKTDITSIASVLTESPDFKFLLESPVAKASQKVKAVRSVFNKQIDSTTLRFIEMIIENKRELHLTGICRNFLDMIRKEQGVKSAVVSSASPLSPEVIDRLKALLEDNYKANVEMNETIDKTLIGGFVLRVEDQQFDASIATQLKKVKENLLKTETK